MRRISYFLTVILVVNICFAGDMIIHKTDGDEVEIPIDEIENITFSTESNQLEQLVEWMTGDFSSEAQADTSSDPYHYNVTLRMVRIWDNQPVEDGYWVYVEQAYAESQDNPYRQRIYRVFEESDGSLKDEIYTFGNASQYVGSWETPEDFDELNETDLTLKPGCGLFFEWQGDHFYGSTEGTDCTTTIPGVDYITSESEIYVDYLTSWDLGYDSNGNVVMGPYSPYIFDKFDNFPIN